MTTKTPTETKTRRRMAATMVAYTLVLALGAALPVVASYSDAITQRTTDGEVEGGAYRRDLDTGACEEVQQAERPVNTAELTPAQVGEVEAPGMGEATECSSTNADSRGS